MRKDTERHKKREVILNITMSFKKLQVKLQRGLKLPLQGTTEPSILTCRKAVSVFIGSRAPSIGIFQFGRQKILQS